MNFLFTITNPLLGSPSFFRRWVDVLNYPRTKDSCDGKVVILFRDNNDRYTVELCGVGNIMKMDGSNVKIGDKIGLSQGEPLYIKVFNSRNEKMMLSDLEKKDTEPDKFNSSDSLDRPTLFDVLMGYLYEPFKGPNKKEKIKEDIDRIKSLL